MGYYNSPDKTSEDFITIDNMRYFCTGDIGQFEEDGCLRIIGKYSLTWDTHLPLSVILRFCRKLVTLFYLCLSPKSSNTNRIS